MTLSTFQCDPASASVSKCSLNVPRWYSIIGDNVWGTAYYYTLCYVLKIKIRKHSPFQIGVFLQPRREVRHWKSIKQWDWRSVRTEVCLASTTLKPWDHELRRSSVLLTLLFLFCQSMKRETGRHIENKRESMKLPVREEIIRQREPHCYQSGHLVRSASGCHPPRMDLQRERLGFQWAQLQDGTNKASLPSTLQCHC